MVKPHCQKKLVRCESRLICALIRALTQCTYNSLLSMNSLFQVSDESANLLSGVLVSLSGNSFRQNRITSENESLIFSNLVSLLSKLLSPAGVIFRGSAGE